VAAHLTGMLKKVLRATAWTAIHSLKSVATLLHCGMDARPLNGH
jgi:hypothetical protein